MPDVSTILNPALEMIRVKDADNDAEDADVSTALSELNDMMLEWHEQGIWLGCTVAIAATDEFTAPDWTYGAVKANLAIRLSEYFGRSVSQLLFERADKGLRMIRNRLTRFDGYKRPSTMPVGAGNLGCNRAHRSEFYANTWQDDIDAGTGQTLADETGATLDHEND